MKLAKFWCLLFFLFLTLYGQAQKGLAQYRDSAQHYHDLGNAYYKKQLRKAIPCYQKSIFFRKRSLENSTDSLKLSHSYNNTGKFQNEILNDYNQALFYLDSALEIRLLMATQPEYVVRTQLAIAECYQNIGDYKRAEDYYRRAVSVADRIGAYELPTLVLNLSQLLNQREAGGEALIELSRLESFEFPREEQQAIYHSSKGYAYSLMENKLLGLQNYQLAYDFFESQKDTLRMSQLLNNIGILQYDINSNNVGFEQAKSTLQTAFSLIKQQHKIPIHLDYAELRHSLGNVYAEQGQLDSALYFYRTSLVNFFGGKPKNQLTMETLLQTGDRISLLTFQQSIAITLLRSYKQSQKKQELEESLSIFLYCDQIIKRLRSSHSSDRSKLFWQSRTRPLYENAIEAALLANRPELAFRFSENAKATLLLESLNELEAHALGNIPKALSTKEKKMQNEIIQLETLQQRAEEGEDELEAQNIQNKLFETREASFEFQKSLETDFPRYYQAKYDTSIAGSRQIQQALLDDKTAMIEYVVSDSAIFIFCLNKMGLRTYQTEWTPKLEQDFSTLLDFLGKHGTDFTTYTSIAHSMYQKLLAPALADLDQVEKLVIIPDDFLAYLPFETLLTAPFTAKKVQYRNLPYLFQQYAITYGYSANVLIKNKQPAPSRSPKILALAPSFKNHKLGALKYSEEEARAVLQLFQGKLLSGDAARRDSLLQQAKGYDILYLSTHASAGRKNAQDNRIYLSQNDSLSLNEVQYLALENLNTKMIVLSACETGRGDLLRGEGVWSMGRSFATIGIPNVLMSLWLVDDKNTRILMEFYFKELKAGKDKSIALQMARKAYFLDDYTSKFHPYYWAAFVNYGDDGALVKRNNWLLAIGFLLLAGLVFFVGWRFFTQRPVTS